MQAAARRPAFSSSSSSSSKRVFISISSALRSNFSGRGKSFAASVPSGPLKPPRGKKLPKQERRALVESFVDKYRASNAGRFPTVSHVRQEIGGSHYILRQIVQEMEYNNKLSALDKGIVQIRKREDIDQSSDAKEESFISVRDEILKPNIENKDEPSVSFKLRVEADTLQSPSTETVGFRAEISAIDFSHDAPYPKVAEYPENDKDFRTEDHNSDHLRSSDQGDSSRTQSSNQGDSSRTTDLWGNLKSLADGIVSFWRKM